MIGTSIGTVRPIPDESLGNTSYLVEAGDGAAISIDPRRDAGRRSPRPPRRWDPPARSTSTRGHPVVITSSRLGTVTASK